MRYEPNVTARSPAYCAWLTDDMWKSGMRSVGITARVAQSLHSLGRVISGRLASVARRSSIRMHEAVAGTRVR